MLRACAGPLTDNTSLCGALPNNASEYNPYPDYSFTFAQPLAGAKIDA